jgi:hypothetical protein
LRQWEIRLGGDFAGLPERLAQQLSKISRKAPGVHLNWDVGPLLRMTKGEALVIELRTITQFALKHGGIPIGNVAEIKKYAHLYGVSGLGAKAAKALSKFLKF